MFVSRTLRSGFFAAVIVLLGCDPAPVETDAAVPTDASRDAGGAHCGPPGLYEPGSCETPALGVRPYSPRYELWSDGTDKERFVYLPPGSVIDTSRADEWIFPAGTRLYKTFLIDGTRLETRVMERLEGPPGAPSWEMRTYAWNAAQDEAIEVRDGVPAALGSTHDIPPQRSCARCHRNIADSVNGFSAIQLAHDGLGVTLGLLRSNGRLSDPISDTEASIPGDPVAVAGLGYLHVNCGSCHSGLTPQSGFSTWVQVGAATVEETQTYVDVVGVNSNWTDGEVTLRVAPGEPDQSAFIRRMRVRDNDGGDQMPPLATDRVDEAGLEAVRAFILSL